ncbi:hypothetical protein [Kyrpidia tusciae]|uniref:hypothetical protein n=1 Tax=Kyrpidia tusciae TaxID=33943 RepID=UPI0002D396D3|nr:hypothetical protein [Kyrpidia tusciae]
MFSQGTTKLYFYCTAFPEVFRHAWLVNAGTEANEMAIELDRLATEKTHIIATLGWGHGNTPDTSVAGVTAIWRFFPIFDGRLL